MGEWAIHGPFLTETTQPFSAGKLSEARCNQEEQEFYRAVECEIERFKSFVDIRVKDYLMVNMAKGGFNAPINIDEVTKLVGLLIEVESQRRIDDQVRIDTIEIPAANTRIGPADHASSFTQEDIPMLKWQSSLQKEVSRRLTALFDLAPGEQRRMVEGLIEDLIEEAEGDLRSIMADRSINWLAIYVRLKVMADEAIKRALQITARENK